ncbi:hypothetical protein EIP91_004992 [Steccherinum ochraceum]|uniref:DUF427 domain-containing protein n=1 Tax=Steccherinum ochraceum TaxID=92696 RepID=A0A4R0R7T5_9APHY|nr:hypothetical protein EIP91_004992 [Steccherinum ochraceum]
MSVLFSPPLPHLEDSPKRIRALFGGEYIVDTTQAKLGWTKKWYPYYYFKPSDLKSKYLVQKAKSDGKTTTYDLVVGDKKAEGAITEYHDGFFRGLALIEFGAIDRWFEEEKQIFVHPKDPYKRVDVLQSSRHVRVELNGVELANTTKPRLLFETLLRTRTYIPPTDVNLGLLRPSTYTTECPYKGVANYYDVHLPDGTVAKNVVWWYRTAQPECAEIEGFLAFYDEKLDVFVDGELVGKAKIETFGLKSLEN